MFEPSVSESGAEPSRNGAPRKGGDPPDDTEIATFYGFRATVTVAEAGAIRGATPSATGAPPPPSQADHAVRYWGE